MRRTGNPIRILLFFFFSFLIGIKVYGQSEFVRENDFANRDDYFILGAQMKRFNLTDGFKAFPIPGREDDLLIPLTDILQAFEFPIFVNPQTGIAKGWFLRENRKFYLDIQKGKLQADGVRLNLTPADAKWESDDIYLRSSLLDKIFPVKTSVDTSTLSLNIESLEPFPFEERLAREKRQKTLRQEAFKKASFEDPYIESEEYFSWPFLDVGLAYQHFDLNSGQSENVSHTIAGRHLFLGLDSAFNIYGNSNTNTNYARINLSRYRPRGDFMGFAKFFEAGDINTYETGLISSPISGRGVNISTFDEKGNATQRNLKLQGLLTEGWDVEVYRNNVLLGFQSSDETGLYQFENLPMELGLNKFKLKFYGPQGQRREEERAVYLSPTSVKKGELAYRVFAQEDVVPLVPLNDERITGRRFGFQSEYGLSDSFSISSAFITFDPIEEIDYIQERDQTRGEIGIKTGFSIFRMGLTAAMSESSNAPAFEGLLEANFADLNLYADHSEFNGMKTEKSFLNNEYIDNISNFYVRGRIPIPGIASLPFFSRAKFANAINGQRYQEFIHTLSLSWWRIYLSLESKQRETFTGIRENLGTSFMNVQLKKFLLRGEARYDFRNNFLQSTTLGLDYRYSSKSVLQTRWIHTQDITQRQRDIYSFNLSHRFDFGTLSIGHTTSSDDEQTFSIAYNTSILHNPMTSELFLDQPGQAQQGALVANGFLDSNYNGVFDENEEILSDMTYEMNGGSNKPRGTDSNYTLMKGIAPYSLVNLKPKEESLDDISYYAGDNHMTIMARPGIPTKVQFPITQLGSVDGEIRFTRGSNRYPLKGIRLYLIKEDEQIDETISDADGYYAFEKIKPGAYRIEPDKEQFDVLRYRLENEIRFEVNEETIFQTLPTLRVK